MNPKIVLYAEGAGEASGPFSRIPEPGEPLEDGHLGAGHWLVRRVIARVLGSPLNAVAFMAPLSLRGRRSARGSDLLVEKNLRQLLGGFVGQRIPDLAVVLVDADEDRGRYEALETIARSVEPSLPTVIGVAVQEFEAWLIADQAAASSIFARTLGQSKAPETMGRTEAKQLLAEWMESANDRKAARIRLARECDLDVIQQRCSSFDRFDRDLRRTLRPPGSHH